MALSASLLTFTMGVQKVLSLRSAMIEMERLINVNREMERLLDSNRDVVTSASSDKDAKGSVISDEMARHSILEMLPKIGRIAPIIAVLAASFSFLGLYKLVETTNGDWSILSLYTAVILSCVFIMSITLNFKILSRIASI